MQRTVAQKVRARVTYARYGVVFYVSSFPEYNDKYVARLLAQFERDGLIIRVYRGVYVKAKKTRFGVVYPSAFELVKAIAKKNKTKVFPTGAAVANRLGFSTQVPMNISFLTSGATRKLKLGNKTVTLIHGSPNNFKFRGKLMPELVQALRSIGEDNVTETVENRVSQLLSVTPETETIEHDLLLAPEWVRQVISRNNRNNKIIK